MPTRMSGSKNMSRPIQPLGFHHHKYPFHYQTVNQISDNKKNNNKRLQGFITS